MSKHKAGGKAEQHKKPEGKRLGVKVSGGQTVTPGRILVRQRGTKITAGDGVRVGRDHTLYSVASGLVKFGTKLGKKFVKVISK